MGLATKNKWDDFSVRLNTSFSKLSFDHLSFCAINLETGECLERHFGLSNSQTVYDLASLTKVMTFGLLGFSHQELLAEENLLLLSEHRAGLPSWGVLPRHGWEELLLQFQLKSAPTLYSDYSALRLMLELEKKVGKEKLFEYFKSNWAKGIKYWTELETNLFCPITGHRNGIAIQGEVHDPNAWNLKRPVVHAGLFSTINSLSETILINYKKHQFAAMKRWLSEKPQDQRFVHGWDTPQLHNSLAGEGMSAFTFGHLGFTGCSVWIDLEKKLAGILLSNATQQFWYAKEQLNQIRREFYSLLWHSSNSLA